MGRQWSYFQHIRMHMSCRQPPSSPCCLRPEPIIVFKVKPLQYKTFTNTWQFASHLPIWSLCQPRKGVLFSLLSRCGNWNSEIWSRWIISRKVGTGTQAFKVQHPLFPLPIWNTNWPMVPSDLHNSEPVPNSVWIIYDFSLPPHLCGQHSWLYPFRAPKCRLCRSESLTHRSSSPHSHPTQAKSLSLIQLPVSEWVKVAQLLFAAA